MDDSHAQFGTRNNATKLFNVLNSKELQIKYTIEYENDNMELNISDVRIRNSLNHSYDLAVYRKPTITNVQIKYSAQEIKFLIYIFPKNGHSIKVLEVTKEYMNNIASIKEGKDTIKINKIVKLLWVPKLGLKKEF